MRGMMLTLAVLLIGCKGRDEARERELAELRQQVETLKQRQAAAEPPVSPPAGQPAPTRVATVAPTAAVPYVEGEWCIFKCFQKALGQEMMKPSFSDESLRMAAVSVSGGTCADSACVSLPRGVTEQLQNAAGCMATEEHRGRCVEVLSAEPSVGPAAPDLCQMIEMVTISYCCDAKPRLLSKSACAAARKGADAFLALPSERRSALLHSTK